MVSELLFSQSKRTSILIGFIFLAVVGFCDYVTGYEAIITVFYLVPISILAWSVGMRAGLVMALASEIAETATDMFSRLNAAEFYSGNIIVAGWNMAIKILFFMILAYIISKLKSSYEEKIILNQELLERTKALETANKDLESFSYAASHDLRSPMITIEGFSNLLIKRYAGKIGDDGKDLLMSIVNNTKKMQQLIADLMSFSRVSTKELQKSEIDMETLTQRVFEELKPTTAQRDVRLELRPLPSSYGDLPMLHQVLFNLLTNAVKFTRIREVALIEVGGYVEADENVFYVKDNGAGFDMSLAHRLFTPFQRIHAASEFEGTGIGLVIVKKVVEKHGGRVWTEGKVNEGATFYFSLPKNQA